MVELEVHTKQFYSPVEWKEISSTSLDLTKSPLPCLLYLPYTMRAHIWTHMKDSPSVCKHGNFWPCDIRGQKIEGKYLKTAIDKILASWGLRQNQQELAAFIPLYDVKDIRNQPFRKIFLWLLIPEGRAGERFKLPVNNHLFLTSLSTCHLLCTNKHNESA